MASGTAIGTRGRLFAIAGGSAGNLVEWFDWYAYSVLTIYFAPVLMPGHDRTTELLNAALIFAVGFLMRPVGAWAMGIYSDRHGRKSGLALSKTTTVRSGSASMRSMSTESCSTVSTSIKLMGPLSNVTFQ